MKLLDQIDDPSDLRRLQEADLPLLAKELREFIIDIVAVKEGHLGASLGVVELTIALHYVFNTPDDRLIWDVGHQAYGHKILSGRKEIFNTNRQLGGLSGFPRPKESEYDPFGTGHSSTSVSAILGMALASGLKGENDRHHIAVIGDASIAAGMAFEALNHAGVCEANVLLILNDNAIGIDPSVGALSHYFNRLKEGDSPGETIFEYLNISYSGPVDGHDLPALLHALKILKGAKGPRLLHIITTKGKGLRQAEEDQVGYHSPGKFNRETGELPLKTGSLPPKYQDVFGLSILELADQNPKIVGITPAMPTGSSLKYMMEAMPDRAFDVGIAEQHAVTLAAGLASQGMLPFCVIYSTFLQRAYDQLIHDVAIQQLPVVFCLDRAGIVGQDGATHHGAFDIAFLRCIPNLTIFAPMNEIELRNMLYTVQLHPQGPVAIRYPRERGLNAVWQLPFKLLPLGKSEELKRGNRIAVLSLGHIGNSITQLIRSLSWGDAVGHYNMRFVKPLDTLQLDFIFGQYEHLITLEDGCMTGGFGSAVLEYANEQGVKLPIKIFGLPDTFFEHGTIEELQLQAGIDPGTIATYINKILNEVP